MQASRAGCGDDGWRVAFLHTQSECCCCCSSRREESKQPHLRIIDDTSMCRQKQQPPRVQAKESRTKTVKPKIAVTESTTARMEKERSYTRRCCRPINQRNASHEGRKNDANNHVTSRQQKELPPPPQKKKTTATKTLGLQRASHHSNQSTES